MARICAWCKKEVGPNPEGLDEGQDTHGICPDCEDELYKEEGWDKEPNRKEVMRCS